MKKLITIMLGLLALAFIFSETATVQTPPQAVTDNEFITGIMGSGLDRGYGNIHDLNVNLWHLYSNTKPGHGWQEVGNDNVWTPVDSYSAAVNSRIELNYSNNFMTYYDRPKFEYLAFGQQSDYQAEPVTQTTENLWFYSHSTHNVGTPETDSGDTVMHCSDIDMNGNNQGWVCKGLKANREQCYGFWYYGPNDSLFNWFVKPRIRVRPYDVQNNPNKPVCRLEVYNWNGGIVDSVTIFAKSFAPYNDPEQYTGQYREEYYYYNVPNPGNDSSARLINDSAFLPEDRKWTYDWTNYWGHPCNIDYRIWWYDEVECWIDYIRVEDWRAYNLFGTGVYHNKFEDWIRDEVAIAIAHNNPRYVHNCYIEEFELNILPCVKRVNEKIQYWSRYYGMDNPPLSLSINSNEAMLRQNIPYLNNFQPLTPQFLYNNVINYVGSYREYINTDYPIDGAPWAESKIPCTLPACNYSCPGGCTWNEEIGILAGSTTPALYDSYLQNYFDNTSDPCWNFIKQLKTGIEVAKLADVPYVPMLQTHMHHSTAGYMIREPLNEELKMMGNVAISYGAKGILWHYYGSYGGMTADSEYSRGLTERRYYYNDPFIPRHNNVYGQWQNGNGSSKFNTIAYLNDLYKNKWGPYLMSFEDDFTYSFICNDETEILNMRNNTYLKSVISYIRGESQPNCATDNPYAMAYDSLIYDCLEETYIQAATFNTIHNNPVQYFMVVNRRCSPVKEGYLDGRRYIRVVFNANSDFFPGANSWKITEIGNDRIPEIPFDKTRSYLIGLGWFEPGEGRLYKVEPVPTKGGTLVANEVISGDLICEDTVFTNGFNITVENNVDILFTDTSNFVIQGGSFTMGNSLYSGVPNITCGAATGNTWNGFVFDSCEVRIYNSTFSGFGSDTSYALNMIDCPLIDIRNNVFSSSQNSTLGAINVTFYDIDSIDNLYIENNTFELTNSVVPAVNILSYAGITTPLIVENNTFSSNTDNSTAILLSGITGGAVKSNTLTNFHIGLNLLSSSMDVSENTISSNLENAIGILAVSGSEIKMNPSGELQLGGMNNISCAETGSINIKVDNSYFNMDFGENIFNIAEVNYSYHMNGWFNAFLPVTTDARENCFKVNSQPQAPPIENLTWGENGGDIDFVFSPYLTGCIPEGCETYYIVDLGGGLYDTICVGGGGDSFLPVETGRGSTASVPNVSTPKGRQSNNTSTQSMYSEKSIILNPKQAYDSLCIYMRLRNYVQAKNKCYELINNYPDSIQSVNAINKLFLAVTATDASQNGVSQLKIYFETLILNHSGNVPLVKRCNYFVQKCKVKMREYSSALTGFQQIITQNPASYEGLVARWDYMATSLLMHGGGTGGFSDVGSEISDLEEKAFKAFEFDESEEFDESFNDDNPFTREEKKAIRNAVNNVLNISRENNDKRIEIITREADNGNNNAKRELEHINKMKEVIKTQKPKNVIEHIKIINSDIQKIFGGKSSNNKSPQNNIPVVYRLAQNYPNPFNPVTTIKYEIPKDSKVKLVVYDLLGREVKVLVNNEIRSAGYYKIEFNMQNYASGVYFYRIKADDTKGNKFIDAKKMVLVK